MQRLAAILTSQEEFPTWSAALTQFRQEFPALLEQKAKQGDWTVCEEVGEEATDVADGSKFSSAGDSKSSDESKTERKPESKTERQTERKADIAAPDMVEDPAWLRRFDDITQRRRAEHEQRNAGGQEEKEQEKEQQQKQKRAVLVLVAAPGEPRGTPQGGFALEDFAGGEDDDNEDGSRLLQELRRRTRAARDGLDLEFIGVETPVTTPFTERLPFRAADLWLRADHPQAGVTLLRALRMQQ